MINDYLYTSIQNLSGYLLALTTSDKLNHPLAWPLEFPTNTLLFWQQRYGVFEKWQ